MIFRAMCPSNHIHGEILNGYVVQGIRNMKGNTVASLYNFGSTKLFMKIY